MNRRDFLKVSAPLAFLPSVGISVLDAAPRLVDMVAVSPGDDVKVALRRLRPGGTVFFNRGGYVIKGRLDLSRYRIAHGARRMASGMSPRKTSPRIDPKKDVVVFREGLN